MFYHITVLKEEAVAGLNVKPSGIYVDCTLGGGGHSKLIAEKLNAAGRLIAFDQDETAISNAKAALSPYRDRVTLIKANFRYLQTELAKLDMFSQYPQVDGILFDLGVSSPQLDQAERGFSYNLDAALDMRMDQGEKITASKVVNEWSEAQLTRIMFEYGEEKFARRIAQQIVKSRAEGQITTTVQLAEIIKNAIPAAARRTGPHPAKRSFQAIRIAVNDEMGALSEALEQSIHCLTSGGRIAVITFHSLEDRLCKQLFAKFVEGCSCPPDFPVCICHKKPIIRWVQKKPQVPTDTEIERNPRARSAKLRVVEKI